MGVVFEAEDPVLQRRVALKVMRPHVAAEATARQRFLREARAMAAVQHERIITVHQSGEAATTAGPVPFLVMPLLRGETLGARLKRERRPALAEVMRIGQEMAEGSAAAHTAGLIHRDVKPENVWLETPPGESGTPLPGGRVKLLDFGLARAAQPEVMLSQPGSLVGTAAYMAPEQAAGEGVDARADLFSLGCVLYEMTTGQRPFTGPNLTSILMKIANHQPAPPHQLDVNVPAAWSELVMRLLEKKPEKRPASAAEVVAAIRALGTGGPGLPRRRGRNLVVAAAGVLLVLLAAWATFSLVNGVPRSDTRTAGSRDTPTFPQPDVAPASVAAARQPLKVLRLDVEHFATVGGLEQPRGRIGKKSFATSCDDQVTVTAELSVPAYCYLIAYRPDGTEELTFPEPQQKDEAPPLTDRPNYPSVSVGVEIGLNEGLGLHAFVLVARSKPLPSYAEWRKQHGESPWARSNALARVVWRLDGTTLRAHTVEDPDARGAGQEVRGAGALPRVTEWLRQETEAEAVSAVAFAVRPRE
jgi:tRNA A-37 threonylcarbamoyl transferase component Bud32